MEALLMSIRERRNGLSGMKLVEIFNLVEQEVQEKNKIYGGNVPMICSNCRTLSKGLVVFLFLFLVFLDSF